MIGMFACLKRGMQWGAGALLALAAAIKAFPIAAIVYLLGGRQWSAASQPFYSFLPSLHLSGPLRGFRGNLAT